MVSMKFIYSLNMKSKSCTALSHTLNHSTLMAAFRVLMSRWEILPASKMPYTTKSNRFKFRLEGVKKFADLNSAKLALLNFYIFLAM